ncbi:MAG: class I SAM-dependent methyltransferase [bacterium]|nr:class I SAM-dependent methyltransferase [bacterium]
MKAACPHQPDPAPLYDVWTADTRTRRYRNEILRYRRLLRMLPRRPAAVVDAGCGTGYMSVLMARRGWSVTAVDANPVSLAAFTDAAARWKIRVHHADLFRFSMEPADGLVCQEVLEHIPDDRSALRKMSDFLKPGGRAVFCVPYRENLDAKTVRCPECGAAVHRSGHLHRYDEAGFAERIRESGFRVIRTERIVNKRAVKWLTSAGLPVTGAALAFDRLMNRLFPAKAAYLAVIAEKRPPRNETAAAVPGRRQGD